MRTSPLLLLVLTGCPEPKSVVARPLFETVDTPLDPDGDDTGATHGLSTRISGPDLDSGFGAALLVEGSRVWVGAPHGEQGAVYKVKGDGLTEVVTGPGRLGSSLAMAPEGLWIGAPLHTDGLGAVVDSKGEIVVTGIGGTGLALASGSPVIVAHGDGITKGNGELVSTTLRPTSIARVGNTIGVGMAVGDTALEIDGRTLPRPEASDEAGFSIAAGDLDQDGTEEWILGAPASGAVHIIDSGDLSIEATLRSDEVGFGAALAVCDLSGDGREDLVVGAPGANLTKGAAYLYTHATVRPTADVQWSGSQVGDRLGTSIACSTAILAMGAPGGANSPGFVQLVDAEAIIAETGGSASRPGPPRSE